jgi:hypothetical protein
MRAAVAGAGAARPQAAPGAESPQAGTAEVAGAGSPQAGTAEVAGAVPPAVEVGAEPAAPVGRPVSAGRVGWSCLSSHSPGLGTGFSPE